MNELWVYDIETYPNCFLFGAEELFGDGRVMFEMSDRRDDREALIQFLVGLHNRRAIMLGFNVLGFDYPVIHTLLSAPDRASYSVAYDKAQQIIGSQNDNRFANMVWASDRFIQQIDLFSLNHFDNGAKMTSLKALQFAMRAESIEELPYEPGTFLTSEQIDVTRAYCDHDISETKRFAYLCRDALDFRLALVPTYGTEVLNWSDAKIGSQYVIRALGDEVCYERQRGRKRTPRQTFRSSIVVREVIFPYIEFRRPECVQVLTRFQNSKILAAKPGALSEISCTLDGFRFDFGVGGVHGSVSKQIVRADDDHLIIDADVTSLYPSIAIENGLYPEHLGQRFVAVYSGLRDERTKHPKGSPINAALKLALNATYGNSNNAWSPMYDPQYTMATTINGQLLLLMLAERLMADKRVQLIQINTDGLTARVHRDAQQHFADVCAEWEALTRLQLEYKLYRMIAVRDVNNYIACDVDGKIKRKGAYDYPTPDEPLGTAPSGPRAWHGDQSALIVQMAAEAALVHGRDLAEFIGAHGDPFDFMLRAKCPRASQLVLDPEFLAEPLPRITRYYAAVHGVPGGAIVKRSPPVEGATPGHYKRKNGITDEEWYAGLRDTPREPFGDGERPAWNEDIHTKNKSTYDDREMCIHPRAAICNKASAFRWQWLDREWYVAEARKLVDCFT